VHGIKVNRETADKERIWRRSVVVNTFVSVKKLLYIGPGYYLDG